MKSAFPPCAFSVQRRRVNEHSNKSNIGLGDFFRKKSSSALMNYRRAFKHINAIKDAFRCMHFLISIQINLLKFWQIALVYYESGNGAKIDF